MTNFENAIFRIPDKKQMPPTERCLICERLKNPEADMVSLAGWICPECKNKLRQIISREVCD